jgi:hypothetical protein
MAGTRGNEKEQAEDTPEVEASEGGGLFPGLPDMARRALAFGLSGFFFTEETFRKALGDTLPKDWQDFAIEQSERTRKEFLERLTFEIAQSIEKIDVARVLDQLLEGRTIEVKAQLRLGKREGGATGTNLHVSVKEEADG